MAANTRAKSMGPWEQYPLKLTIKNQNWHSAAKWMKVSVSRLGLALLNKLPQIIDVANKCTTALAVVSVEIRYQIVAQYFTTTHSFRYFRAVC